MIVQTIKSIKEKVYQRKDEIQGLPDDELMDLHLMLIDSKVSAKVKGGKDDPLRSTAVCREVERRQVASGLFWQRWRDQETYRKWQIHSQLAEIISAQSMIEELERELER